MNSALPVFATPAVPGPRHTVPTAGRERSA